MKKKEPNDNLLIIFATLILIGIGVIGYSVLSYNIELNKTYTTPATIKTYR